MRVAILVLVFIATVQAAPKVTSTEKNVHHSGGIDGALAAARALEQDVAHLLEEEPTGDEDEKQFTQYFSAYKPSEKGENANLNVMCDIATKMLKAGYDRNVVIYQITKNLLRVGRTPDHRERNKEIIKKVDEGKNEHDAIVEQKDFELTNCIASVVDKLKLDTGNHQALTRSVYSDDYRISRPKGLTPDEKLDWAVDRGICPFVNEANRNKNVDGGLHACTAICTEENKDCFVPYRNKHFAGSDADGNELYHLLPGKCKAKAREMKCVIDYKLCCKKFPVSDLGKKKQFTFPQTPAKNPGHPVCQNSQGPLCQ